MKSTRPGTYVAALSLTAMALAFPVSAQEEPGRSGVLSYGTGFEYDFEDGLTLNTDVALTLRMSTAIDRFELGFGTQLQGDFTDDGDDDFSFRNRFVTADFERRVANSSLSLSAGYTETDLEDEVDTSGPVLVITDQGELATTRASARLQTGIEGPFGLTLDARYRDRDYTGTTDPDLVDETEIGADVLARFALSRSMDLRARAGITLTDEDDAAGTESEATYVGIGLGGTSGQNLSFSADLLFDRTKETTTAPISSSTEDGFGVEIAVTQGRPDGSIGARLDSRIDDAGRRTTATVSRSYDLPTGGLSFSLGVADNEGDDKLRVIGSLDYSTGTGDGRTFTASIAQDAASDDGSTVVSTRLELSYAQAINEVSGWQAGLGYFATDDLGGGDDDNRTTATLSYTRAITPEWSMNTGYSYSREDDGEEDNSIFFNVTRDITFGF